MSQSHTKSYTRLILCKCENLEINIDCMHCGEFVSEMSKDEFYVYFYQIRDQCKMLDVVDRRMQKRYAALRRMEKELIDIPCQCEYDKKCVYCGFLGSVGDF